MAGGSGAEAIRGDAGNDTLDGGPGADTIFGGEGNDSLIGGSGNDTIDGGAGDDTVTYDGNRSEYTVAASGETTTVSQNGSGEVDALTNVEHIAFADQTINIDPRDTISGASGADTINGWGGDDSLIGGDGDDSIVGGSGGDTLVGGLGDNWLNGGSGVDTVSYASASSGVYVDIVGEDGSVNDAPWYDLLQSIENVIGSSYDDVISPNDAATFLDGGAGYDILSLYEFVSAVNINMASGAVGRFDGYFSPLTIQNFEVVSGTQFSDTIVGDSSANWLEGIQGDDSIDGGSGADTVVGDYGDDTLVGGDGVDLLTYENQYEAINVTLSASGPQSTGQGPDTIYGFENLKGSLSNDTIGGNSGSNSLFGNGGDDSIAGYEGNDTLSGQAGADRIDGGAGSDQANYSGFKAGFTFVQNADGTITVTDTVGAEGSDTLSNVESLYFAGDGVAWSTSELLSNSGTAGDDPLTGTSGDNALSGLAGNDTLAGLSGNDTLTGAAGGDLIDGGAGTDQANYAGSSGNFTFTRNADGTATVTDGVGSEGADTLTGIETVYFGGDSVSASFSSLVVNYGTTGDDSISGLGGGDKVYGLAGNDTLAGLAGNDTLTGAAGGDLIDGGAGTDQANYAGSSTNFTFARNADGSVTATDTVGSEGADTLTGVETVYFQGNSVSSSLSSLVVDYGTSGNDSISGLAGNDKVYGLAGNDTLAGLVGNDTLTGAAGGDLIDGGSGTDQANYSGFRAGFSFVQNANGTITVTDTVGGEGADTLTGVEAVYFAGDNTTVAVADLVSGSNLSGTTGNDTLTGQGGNDTLSGLGGNDTLKGAAGNDLIDGGTGTDQANYTGLKTSFTYSRNADGSVNITDGVGGEGADTLVGIETVYFQASSIWSSIASLVGDYGTTGNDAWLAGTSGNDNLYGLAGNDTFKGNAGNDRIDGGAGTDQANYSGYSANFTFVLNGDGSITVTDTVGNQGSDTLVGVESVYFESDDYWSQLSYIMASPTSGNDTINGRSGNDTISGLGGADHLYGARGNDVLDGGAGSDQATYMGASTNFTFVRNADGSVTVTDTVGSEGADTLIGMESAWFEGNSAWYSLSSLVVNYGTSGNDSITGLAGNDNLYGLAGNDNLSGANGNDTIVGGAGADTLTGGAGTDYFSYAGTSEAAVGSPDIIADFVQGTDKIDLSAIDANSGVSGDQAFTWIGTSAFSNVAGQLRYATTPSGARTIYGDVDGNGTADFQIQVTGSVSFAATDFVL